MDDNKLINFQLEQIKAQLTDMSETQKGISERLGKIEHHLYNDTETESDGIVKKVRTIDHRLKFLEEKDKIKDAKMATWGAIGGGILMAIFEVVKYIFSQHK